jgi:hypothetical protein
MAVDIDRRRLAIVRLGIAGRIVRILVLGTCGGRISGLTGRPRLGGRIARGLRGSGSQARAAQQQQAKRDRNT